MKAWIYWHADTVICAVVIGAVVTLVTGLIMWMVKADNEFRDSCTEAGGRTEVLQEYKSQSYLCLSPDGRVLKTG